MPPVCKTGVYETGRSADERFESSGTHHADVVDWVNAGAPLRRKEFDSPRPRQIRAHCFGAHIAWEADLVTAPRRKRGEVGSKPTPGTNFRGQHKGADDPCKIVAVGALPTVSTNSFPSSHLGEGGRLLTGEAWFEPRGGSQYAPFV